MFFNREKVLGFGQKKVEAEKESPVEAFHELYNTDEEIKALVDEYKKQTERVLVFSDVTLEDRSLLEQAEQTVITKLADVGIDIAPETLDEFISTL